MAVRFAVTVLVLLCLCAPAFAEDYPRSDLFGGFSYMRDSEINFPGWQAAIAFNQTARWSYVGDFGGQYRDGVKNHEYMGGLRANFRTKNVTPFAHILVGGRMVSAFGESLKGFDISPGGGLDIKTGKRISIRAVQVDYISDRGQGIWSQSFRLGFGVVFSLGK